MGEWQIGDHTVIVTEATLIDEHKATAAVGVSVRVKATRSGDSVVAVEIVVTKGKNGHDDKPGNRFIKFEGTVETLPAGGTLGTWTVSGRSVLVDERTRIKGDHGNLGVGSTVEIKGYQRADNIIEARQIEVEKQDDEGKEVELEGTIEVLPGDPQYIGIWVVSNQTVHVTAETEIDKRGWVRLGAQVEIKGHTREDNSIVAEKIKVEKK